MMFADCGLTEEQFESNIVFMGVLMNFEKRKVSVAQDGCWQAHQW
jgi:hypothetical protein